MTSPRSRGSRTPAHFSRFTTPTATRPIARFVQRGVEVIDGPEEHFYGTDFGLRDPFGNNLRIVGPKAGPLEVPETFA